MKETDTKESKRVRENPRRTTAFGEENLVTRLHDPHRPEGSARPQTHSLALYSRHVVMSSSLCQHHLFSERGQIGNSHWPDHIT